MPAKGKTGSRNQVAQAAERPWLLIVCGVLGLGGCSALIIGTLVAPIYVPSHDWVADTISDLAAGRWEILMDVALYGFAAGLMGTSIAAAHAHMGKAGWSVGVMSLALLAAIVVIIGARNEYGDNDNEGVVIHIYLVYAMGALFALLSAAMQAGLRASGHQRASWWIIALGIGWAIMSPVFLMSFTSIDGLLERILGLFACGMIVVLSLVFLRRGLDCREG